MSSAFQNIDWNGITDRYLYIVPQGDTANPHYWKQSTVELTEMAQKVCEAAGLSSALLPETIQAVICWAFRNYSTLQTCQMNGVLFFENVVFISDAPLR
jgi:hypothetical protein